MTHRTFDPIQSDAQTAQIEASHPAPRPARLTRRSLFKVAGGIAAGLAVSNVLPFGGPLLGEAQAAASPFAAYHGVSGAEHQNRFNSLSQQGFRPMSLSVYRTTEGVRYAAIWVQQGGPAWYAFHGLSADAYQQKFNEMTSQGFRPQIITGTGGGEIGIGQVNDPVYAAVFVKDGVQFLARHGINGRGYQDANTWAHQHGYVLTSASILGGRDRQYAGIWEKVSGAVDWDENVSITIDGPEQGVPTKQGGMALSYITRAPFGETLAVYRSDQRGDRVVHQAMTAGQYQAQFNAMTGQGYVPVLVQAGGDPRGGGREPKFVAIFQRF